MYPIKLDQEFSEQINYGSVSNLGALVYSGDPQAAGGVIYGSPGAPVFVGWFRCTTGKFLMHHPRGEHGTVLRGAVILTDEVSGKVMRYEVGDSWFLEAGSLVCWDVISPIFFKQFMVAG